MPAMSSMAAQGSYVGGPAVHSYYDPRVPTVALYSAEANAGLLLHDAVYIGSASEQVAAYGCASARSQPRCPLRDISNVAARFAAGVKLSKPTAVRTQLPQAVTGHLLIPTAEMVDADGSEEASEYVSSVFCQLFKKETAAMPWVKYMDSQLEVNPKMRGILIDWLVDVQAKYKMKSDTLFLTVNLIDRYLSRSKATRRRLQLVGVVAMLVAAKFEELEAPQTDSLVYITDNAYTRKEILDMECSFLATLGFNVLVPTAVHFLERLQRANRGDTFHKHLAQYILELGLVEYRMIGYEPSRAAAAAVYLSNRLLGVRPAWSPAMAQLSRWSQESLEACAQEYQALLHDAPHNSLQAVRKKYSEPKRASVAKSSLQGQ